MFIDSMASYHLNTQHYQMAKKTPRPRITKTTTNQNACWHWDHDRHITWHSAWHPPKTYMYIYTYIHIYIYIYTYTHTYSCICISTCTNAHIHTPTVDITQSTMQSAMPRRRYQDMHRTTAMHIPMSEITRRLRHWCGKEQCTIFAKPNAVII